MLGENLTGLLVPLFGYGYPAYECFRTLEQKQHHHPSNSSRQLQFWCQYWIIVAILTMIEMLGDFLLPLLPAYYSQAKLVFLVYLWHPKTMGSGVVYEALLRPLVMHYELDIEKKLRVLIANSGQLLVFYLKNLTEKGQTLFMEALRHAVSRAAAPRNSTQERKRRAVDELKEEERRDVVEKLEEEKERRRRGVEKLEDIADRLIANSSGEKHR